MECLIRCKRLLAVSFIAALAACSSDDGNDQMMIVTPEAPNDEPVIVSTSGQLASDDVAQDMLNGTGFAPPGDASDTMLARDTGDFQPAVFESDTDVDIIYAQAGAALVDSFNEAIALPADVAVNFIDCGTANAFYAPPGLNLDTGFEVIAAGGAIFMCHELTALLGQLFTETNQVFSASVFVLMHEIGHALVNQLDLPVLGIEESYVDGIAAVLVGESGLAEASVFAGFFFGEQPQTPFFDSHRAGPQRLGDLACWGIGADDELVQDPFIDRISQQLIAGGRDCAGEYAQQLAALQTIIGPYVRGGLSDTFDAALVP